MFYIKVVGSDGGRRTNQPLTCNFLVLSSKNLVHSTNLWYYIVVRAKQRRILAQIFEKPDRKDVKWSDFISVLTALGADIVERGGSMVGVRLKGRYAVFHRPHPGNEIYPTDLKRIRRFLLESGALEEENWSS